MCLCSAVLYAVIVLQCFCLFNVLLNNFTSPLLFNGVSSQYTIRFNIGAKVFVLVNMTNLKSVYSLTGVDNCCHVSK